MEYLALSFDPNAKRSGGEKTKEREKPGRREGPLHTVLCGTYIPSARRDEVDPWWGMKHGDGLCVTSALLHYIRKAARTVKARLGDANDEN